MVKSTGSVKLQFEYFQGYLDEVYKRTGVQPTAKEVKELFEKFVSGKIKFANANATTNVGMNMGKLKPQTLTQTEMANGVEFKYSKTKEGFTNTYIIRKTPAGKRELIFENKTPTASPTPQEEYKHVMVIGGQDTDKTPNPQLTRNGLNVLPRVPNVQSNQPVKPPKQSKKVAVNWGGRIVLVVLVVALALLVTFIGTEHYDEFIANNPGITITNPAPNTNPSHTEAAPGDEAVKGENPQPNITGDAVVEGVNGQGSVDKVDDNDRYEHSKHEQADASGAATDAADPTKTGTPTEDKTNTTGKKDPYVPVMPGVNFGDGQATVEDTTEDQDYSK